VKLQFKKRRFLPAMLAILVLVVGSGVAYAYWTAGGAGTGTGSMASPASVTATSAALIPMYPGNASQPIVITITNPSATQAVHVTQVLVAVGDSTPAGCDGTNFTLAANPVLIGASGVDIAASGSLVLSTANSYVPPTILMKDLASSQDVCKSKTVNLTFTVS
jgi:hypothetical protein